MKKQPYDLITIGAGAAGIMSAITAAKNGKRVLLLEKLPQIAAKLKATGGGKCNLTNTLSNEEFMSRFGRNGRFMQDALLLFDSKDLVEFFHSLGVLTHAPDGYRVFPTSHSSSTILEALHKEIENQNITLLTSQKVLNIIKNDDKLFEIETTNNSFLCSHLIIATGGLGYPTLGAEGDGLTLAKKLGHAITELFPAMMPLHTKESWVKNCRADTIPKAELRVDMKKHKNIKAQGDLIFTNHGIRGPVVLDFAREITPLIEKYGEVPLVLNLIKGMDEDKIHTHLKQHAIEKPYILELLETLLPSSLAKEMAILAKIDLSYLYKNITGLQKESLLKILANTPLTIIGHDGFKMAMITRGGISLKEIDPKTMQSKIVKGLYFCGEVVDIDGPCGGYNLQWSFSSGALAGELRS